MSGFSSLLSSISAGLGILLSSPVGPAQMPVVNLDELTARASPAYVVDIRDSSGASLGRIMGEAPLASPLDLLPLRFLEAVIAIEDRRFLSHAGLDAWGMSSALASQFGPNPRGGSTIDQQMAKNAWTGSAQSLLRKIPEAVLALYARHHLGAAGVLRLYLETAWFGRGVTGAAGAAHAWFDRDWEALSLGEIAFLAGILKGPGFFDPERHPERALSRRNLVIDAMLREGFISEGEAEAARSEPLSPAPRQSLGPGAGQGRWFMPAVAREISAHMGHRSDQEPLLSRVSAELTLDPHWQAIAQGALADAVSRLSPAAPLGQLDEALIEEFRLAAVAGRALVREARTHLSGFLPWDRDLVASVILEADEAGIMLLLATGDVRYLPVPPGAPADLIPGQVFAFSGRDETNPIRARNVVEGAVVLIDPRDGSILASIGGSDPSISEFDRARARRQPGSAIKAFLWLAALERGYLPSSPVPDFEQEFITEDGALWSPRNYGGSQSGMVTLASAFEQSSNLVAASLINALGSDAMGRMAESAGAYPSGMPRHMTAALGTMEVSLVDLTRAYAAVINDGVPRPDTFIRNLHLDGRTIISDGIAVSAGRSGDGPIARRASIQDMISMMRGVVLRGTASVAFRGHPVVIAGKTGTTQGYRDAWFVGVTPHLAIGVWLGRDDNQPMPGRIAGGSHAAPIAARILREAHEEGLIDADGFRDAHRAAGINWPPALIEANPHVASQPEAPHGQPVGATFVDPFWGVVGEAGASRPTSAPGHRPFHSVNRNADLLRDRWN